MRDDVPWVEYNPATGKATVVTDDEGNQRMVNAHDVQYAVKRTLDPKTGSEYAYVLYIIEGARMIGASDMRIVFRHLLPNILTPVIVMMLLDIGPAIIAIGVLSFLGLGTQPPNADWGLMVWNGAQNLLGEWWIAIVPGFAMFLLVTAFNIFGDTLKEILDPQ